ncbi:MAG TPA: phospholipase D-like domain-containing protein, partial [Rubricoccaceae bacterium]
MIRTARLAALLVATAAAAGAQTNPAPHVLASGDYTFTAWSETAPAGTYPASMRFWRGGGQDPALAAEPTADYTLAYNLTAGTRLNGLNGEGLAFANLGTNGDLGAAVVALDVTSLSNVRVSWTAGTIATGTRPYAIRLQTRVGTSGAWTDVPGPVEYVASATAGDVQTFSTVLPTSVNGQPLVQVRWKYYQVATGTGGRPRLRLDDITISSSDSEASGSGTASFDRTAYRGGLVQDIALTVTARSDAPADRLTHVTLTLPAAFASPDPARITLAPAGGTVTAEGRTVRIAGTSASLSAPLRITLGAVAVPDVSLVADAAVRTGAGSALTVALAVQPALRVWSEPEAISAVRTNTSTGAATRLGQTVTIRGVVTAAREFRTGASDRGPTYLEDATAGIAVFSPAGVSASVEVGEEVTLLGRVDQFFGLNQLDASTVVVQRSGAPGAPAPLLVTLAQLTADGAGGVERFEGRLVRIDGVTVNTAVWTAEGAGSNYILTDATGTFAVRVNPGTDLAGQPAPAGAFDIVGVVSQFRSAAPYIGGYQLQPRSRTDVLDASNAPVIAPAAPFETAVTSTSVTLRWTTDRPAHSEVRYTSPTGTTGRVVDEARTTTHTVTLTGLAPATIYRLALRSAADADTAVVVGYPVSTSAAPGTTETVEVYFNHTVDASVATGPVAQNVNLTSILLPRLASATETIDLALYSLSGSVGTQIGNALLAARSRGVRVRLILDDDTNPAEPDRLRAAGLAVITDGFGQNDGAFGLHHNKFVVIDRASTDPTRAWTMTGSWNPTDSGTTDNQQNVVWIQDGALAGAFTAEFEQMWGSSTATPDPATSRFHRRKTLVAPTAFWIGGTYTRLLFSPQGAGPYGTVEAAITGAMRTADHEIALNLNLITRTAYVDAARERFDAGVAVRAAIGDIGTTGSVFAPLDAFADAYAFPSNTLGLLHHKTAIIDGQHPQSDPIVITGSHNWSRSANEDNNENTIFLYNAAVANLYLQEFAARYREAGGTGTFPTGASDAPDALRFSISAPAPNPVRGAARVTVSLPEAASLDVRLFNVLGQEVARVADGEHAAGAHTLTVETGRLAPGVYLLRVEAGARAET